MSVNNMTLLILKYSNTYLEIILIDFCPIILKLVMIFIRAYFLKHTNLYANIVLLTKIRSLDCSIFCVFLIKINTTVENIAVVHAYLLLVLIY